LADLVRRKMYSWDFVGLSVTDSGMGFGLAHTISALRYHPSDCNANATRRG